MEEAIFPATLTIAAWGIGGILVMMLISDLVRTALAARRPQCQLMRRFLLPDRCIGPCPPVGQRRPVCAATRTRPFWGLPFLRQDADCACVLPVAPGGGGGGQGG